MTPKMQEALYQISLCHDPNPEVVFTKIVETVSCHYSNTMAMINLLEEDFVRFRAVANPRLRAKQMGTLALKNTF